jgi:catechol 2,3-dioxygenase-like lactoylglutathione lyase family enzyme
MSSPSLTGPDFIAFVVDDVEAANAFWRDVVGLEPAAHSPPQARVFNTSPIPVAIRAPRPGEPQNGPFGRMFTLVAPGGFVVTVHAGAP